MTPEAQRIAIAQHLGWHGIENSGPLNFPWSGYPPTNAIIGQKQQLPDWGSDLNLMHEAEKHLGSINNLSKYTDYLDRVCVPTHIYPLTHWQGVVMATSEQRLEAYIRAIGKWVES